MNYRERYEKLVNSDWFKEIYHNKSLGDCPVEIPELRETEDERIKNLIYCIVRDTPEVESKLKSNGVSLDNALSWFEKQKECKWSEEDDLIRTEAIYFINEFQKSDRCINENDMQNSVTCENWLKSIKSKLHWKPSEEQLDALACAITDIKILKERENLPILESLYNNLKNL